MTTRDFLSTDYRIYFDDWGIQSHTLELGYTQHLNRWFTWRARGRYYMQTGTDFYRSIYSSHEGFHTADRELGPFTSGMGGVKTMFYLGKALGMRELVLDLKADLMQQSFSDFPQLDERLMVVTELGLSMAY